MIERLKSWADGLDIDFTRWRYLFGGISTAMVVLSWLAFFVIGPNWGTDFTGGTEIHLKFDQETHIAEVRTGLKGLGLTDDAVQGINGDGSNEFVVRIADPTFGMEGLTDQVRDELSKLYGADWITTMSASAEVSARFVVGYSGEIKDHNQITRDLQATFPGSRASPSKEESQVVIEVPGLADRIAKLMQAELGDRTFKVLSTDSVGPKVGADLRRQGFISLAATGLLILVYVAFRFDVEYAPGAVVALFHDVSVTMGIIVLLQMDFSLQTVGALLTILGYSINDTIIIYDRIRENKDRYRASDMGMLINKSVSETLTRTLATSFTVFIALLAFLIWGGPVLRDFAITMLCGVVFGTYSTIYIASPIIMVTNDLKPMIQKLLVIRDLDADEVPASFATGGIGPGDQPMTESEKRRRVRAEADKRDPLQ
ncbi:MAG: protein translocase subunit SecF [Alphaproteobacteria bacterium]|nr:protein translocase subunit SecF [Alphaproteobacteria bacterium]MCB9696386.1 protein translocase subunit SecF [Alphaproteobacteria bacterium]